MKNTSQKQAWFVWTIAIIFVIFQFTQQMSAGVMTSAWMHDFKVGPIGLSYLSSVFYYAFLLLQIPAGLLFDSFGPRRVLCFAATILCIGCLLLSVAKTLSIALLARFIMGSGATFAFVGMLCLVSEWFPARRFALLVSLSETVGMVATSCMVVLFAWVVAHSSWQLAMNISGIIAGILAIAVFFFVRDKPHPDLEIGLKKKSIFSQLALVFGKKDVWLNGIFGFFAFAFLTIFASLWGEPFLMKTYHMSLHLATLGASMTLIGIAIGGPLLSFISSTICRRKPIMCGSMFIAFFASMALFTSNNLSTFMIFFLILLCGILSSSYILAFTMAKEITMHSVRGTAMAAINLIIMSSAIILQPAVGWLIHANICHLSHTNAYRLALLIIPFGFLLAMVSTFFMRETFCRGIDD